MVCYLLILHPYVVALKARRTAGLVSRDLAAIHGDQKHVVGEVGQDAGGGPGVTTWTYPPAVLTWSSCHPSNWELETWRSWGDGHQWPTVLRIVRIYLLVSDSEHGVGLGHYG